MPTIIKFPVHFGVITVSDVKDPEKIGEELKQHGNVHGHVFTTDEGKVKIGAFIWKWKRWLNRDRFYVGILVGIPSLKEAVQEAKLQLAFKRDLINLKKFHENSLKTDLTNSIYSDLHFI